MQAGRPGETIPTEKMAAIDAFIAQQMEAFDIPGLSLAVIENGEVTHVRSYGVADRENNIPVKMSTLFETASLSKPVFAYFTMMQVDKAVIALDQPLHAYLPHPDIDDPRARAITARMALTHQTGFPNWRWQNEDEALNIKFDPGTRFSYSGEGFEYLAMTIAHQLGLSLTELADQVAKDLTVPLGIDHAYWTWNETLSKTVATGYSDNAPKTPWEIERLIASASLHTNAADYAKIVLAMLAGVGLCEATHAEMLSPQIVLSNDDDFRIDFGLDAWGLGVALKTTPYGRAVTHGGVNDGFTSWFTVLQDVETGYVFLTNSESGPELNKALEPWLLGQLRQ